MDTHIDTLNQLLEQLRHATKDEYKSIGVTLNLSPKELEPFMFWSDKHYTRNCIIKEGDYELILLCWEPGQGTSIHCHGGEECWVYMIDGLIEESNYIYEDQNLVLQSKSKMSAGDKSFMNDNFGYHKLQNNSSKRALSLHLYMNPIEKCTVFNSNLNEFVPKSLTYHSYNGVTHKVEV